MSVIHGATLDPLRWIKDPAALSPSWFPISAPVHVTETDLDDLEVISDETKKNSRLSLHSNSDSLVHEMIICQRIDQPHPPKKHRDRDKTFMILRGLLLVATFDDGGNVLEKWLLQTGSLICVRIPMGTFHCDVAVSDVATHLETTMGPFDRTSDREYLYGANAKATKRWAELSKELRTS
jgi:cupin fold WbuC family metalloprotein